MSTLEAAAILDCGPDNIRALVRGGRLPVAIATRAGRLLRRADVQRMAVERQQLRAREPKK
ncbi:MAG: hypothetical protein IT179_14460 [Acidobacteria bacterium]|nr:hypothetical protein [Acidobacteriota bacterium]